jgi:hypothetical protein
MAWRSRGRGARERQGRGGLRAAVRGIATTPASPQKSPPSPRQQPRNPSGAQWFPAVLGHLWARAVPRLDTLLKKTILGK